ncbi:MAG: ribonuclease HII [Oscillospiraceae bacterium]|nr:ribonuclease HII [Oscillospiraceae bacterium]
MIEIDTWAHERACWAEGYQMVAGTDEAGAGPLAGAVFAAAVILPPLEQIAGLTDSKKLGEKKREALYDEICARALSWSVTWVDETEIDRINILQARLRAMRRAAETLDPPADFVLVDGNRDAGMTFPHRTVIQGDSLSANISAASILAKVSRDRYMLRLAEEYPQYAFERHKGYGTKLHYERLRQYGPCPVHRRSFLKNL